MTHSDVITDSTFIYETIMGTQEKFDKWFKIPLEKLDADGGFIILISLFPLYECYLRSKYGSEFKFSKGHPVFKTIGRDFKLKEDVAYYFWQTFRNGLLHRAIPDAETKKWILSRKSKAVEFKNDEFIVNPIKLRELILNILKSNLQIWKNDIRLPYEYEEFDN